MIFNSTQKHAHRFIFLIALSMLFILFSKENILAQDTEVKLPRYLKGVFKDDYKGSYEISNDFWKHDAQNQYKILIVDKVQQYIIVEKLNADPTKGGIYTRIDYMKFKKMKPYKWGFCYTAYDVESEEEAQNVRPPDRSKPKTACNGYPFSRMKASK